MRKFQKIAIAVILALFITGCSQTYVDPNFGKVAYDDLNRSGNPAEWQIKVEFQRNGVTFPLAHEELLMNVERVVRASGMVIPTDNSESPELMVVVNNVVNLGGAAAKGLASGLTLGIVGNRVTNFYEMKIVFTDGEAVFKKSDYMHAIHTTVGNASVPSGVIPMSPYAAFSVVVEQLMLNALKDIEVELEVRKKISPVSYYAPVCGVCAA